ISSRMGTRPAVLARRMAWTGPSWRSSAGDARRSKHVIRSTENAHAARPDQKSGDDERDPPDQCAAHNTDDPGDDKYGGNDPQKCVHALTFTLPAPRHATRGDDASHHSQPGTWGAPSLDSPGRESRSHGKRRRPHHE